MPLFGPFARPGGLLGRAFPRDDFLDPENLAAYRDFLRRAGGSGPAGGGAFPPEDQDVRMPSDLDPWDLARKRGSSPAPVSQAVTGAPVPGSDTGAFTASGTGAPPAALAFPLRGAPATARRQLFGPLANLPPLR